VQFAAQGEALQLAAGATAIPVERIKVAADPRREELMRISHAHKELVVQLIRDWLKEEKQRLRAEMNAKQSETS
jgi:hypothetical protein